MFKKLTIKKQLKKEMKALQNSQLSAISELKRLQKSL